MEEKITNRVDADTLDQLAQFARDQFDNKMGEARTLFDQPPPDPADKMYFRDVTFKNNAERALLQNIKLLAQMLSGAVHPIGKNTDEEKKEAASWIRRASKELDAPAKVRESAKLKREEQAKRGLGDGGISAAKRVKRAAKKDAE